MKAALCYLCEFPTGQIVRHVPNIDETTPPIPGSRIVGISTPFNETLIVQGGISSPAFVRKEPRKERLK